MNKLYLFNVLWAILGMPLYVEGKKHKDKQDVVATDEHTIYWQSQKKYLVDPQDFYGSFPAELDTFITMFHHKSEFMQAGVYKSSNFIFYGPPGTGKTYIASVFAQKLGAEFMYVQGTDLLDQWQGSGFTKPTELFEKARLRRDKVNKPVVMFIDEIDTVVKARDGYVHEGTLQLIGTLLKEIGASINNNIIVIAATNKIENIDTALLRSGRFEHHVYFNYPNTYDRKNFMLFLIKPYAFLFDDKINWDLIAYNTAGYTFADLRKIIDCLKQQFILYRIQYDIVDGKISSEIIELLAPHLVVPIKQSVVVDSCWYAYMKKVFWNMVPNALR